MVQQKISHTLTNEIKNVTSEEVQALETFVSGSNRDKLGLHDQESSYCDEDVYPIYDDTEFYEYENEENIDEYPKQPGDAKKGKKPIIPTSHKWTKEEDAKLLGLYEEHDNKMTKNARHFFKLLTDLMNEDSQVDGVLMFSYDIVKKRISDLQKRYKDAKANDGKTGNETTNCENYRVSYKISIKYNPIIIIAIAIKFFVVQLLDQIFKNKKWLMPASIAGSSFDWTDSPPKKKCSKFFEKFINSIINRPV